MEGESDMPVPGSEGDWGNCLGNACRYPVDWNTGNVLWPLSGLEPCSESDFAYMMAFVPRGCKEVACDHPGDASECDCCLGPDPESDGDENIELFVLLSRYKVIRQIESVDARGQRFYQLIRRSRCDFHALGRNPCRDSLWHTKADKRPEYVNVLDPWGNLCDSYPWLCAQEHNTIRARCFCCRSAEMKCSRTQVVDPETGATACELIGRKQ